MILIEIFFVYLVWTKNRLKMCVCVCVCEGDKFWEEQLLWISFKEIAYWVFETLCIFPVGGVKLKHLF